MQQERSTCLYFSRGVAVFLLHCPLDTAVQCWTPCKHLGRVEVLGTGDSRIYVMETAELWPSSCILEEPPVSFSFSQTRVKSSHIWTPAQQVALTAFHVNITLLSKVPLGPGECNTPCSELTCDCEGTCWCPHVRVSVYFHHICLDTCRESI